MASLCVKEVRAAGLMIFRVLNRKIEYLLLQASYLEHHWTPPKGHVDPGEDDLTTAKREVQEESGLRPDDYEIIDGFSAILRYKVNNKPKRVTYWAAKVKNPNVSIILSHEHEDFRWADFPTLSQMTDKSDMIESYQNCENFLLKSFFPTNATSESP